MPFRPEPIRGRRAFAEIRARGRRIGGRLVTLQILPAAAGDAVRVSFAIGRHVGPAVVRNRVRRRLRALVSGRVLPPGAYLIGARPGAAGASFAALGADLQSAFDRGLRSDSLTGVPSGEATSG